MIYNQNKKKNYCMEQKKSNQQKKINLMGYHIILKKLEPPNIKTLLLNFNNHHNHT